MEWEKPEIVQISLACEISSYANAELSVSPTLATCEKLGCGAKEIASILGEKTGAFLLE